MMDIRLPRLGEGADSGTVASIFVKEGDRLKKDQPILELESEKAVATIPSPAAGTVTKLHVKEGDEVKVGQLILSISEDGAAEMQALPQRPAIDATVGDEVPGEVSPLLGAEQVEEQPTAAERPFPEPPVRTGILPAASPSIRKMARDLGIDLARIRGTERGGRIVLADLRQYIQRLQQIAARQKAVSDEPAKSAMGSIDFSKWGRVRRKKMSTLRSTISSRMVESWTTIPHITQFDEVDVSNLLLLRKKYASTYEKKGGHLTLTPFVMKVLVQLLQKHPMFNASVDDLAGEIVYKEYYHFGIAVDTERGLIVPVIRDVDKKNLLELAVELHRLAERTRERKVSLEEMQGGSFTISNQGGIGGAHFTPIINKPEVAILGMGRGSEKAVVRRGKIAKRVMLPVALSYDHRIIDGADAARFMVDFAQALQDFKEADVKI